jgi:hypothetical protein
MKRVSLYRLYRDELVRVWVVGFDLGQASKEEAVEKVRYQPEANVRLYPKRQKGRIKRPLFLRAPDKSSRDKHCG